MEDESRDSTKGKAMVKRTTIKTKNFFCKSDGHIFQKAKERRRKETRKLE